MIIVVACTEASIANTQYDNKLNFYNSSAQNCKSPQLCLVNAYFWLDNQLLRWCNLN